MIRNYSLSKTDIRLTNNYNIEVGDCIDYKNQVCLKPWGYEFLSYMSKKIGIWILSVKKIPELQFILILKKMLF